MHPLVLWAHQHSTCPGIIPAENTSEATPTLVSSTENATSATIAPAALAPVAHMDLLADMPFSGVSQPSSSSGLNPENVAPSFGNGSTVVATAGGGIRVHHLTSALEFALSTNVLPSHLANNHRYHSPNPAPKSVLESDLRYFTDILLSKVYRKEGITHIRNGTPFLDYRYECFLTCLYI
jgi:hypothetical protein